jgi:signal transduction histidine kinase
MSRTTESLPSGRTEQEIQTLLARKLVALINERQREMTRVSRVLHDSVGQVLSAVGLQLDVMRMDFQNAVPGIVARTAEIQQMLEGVIGELRGLSWADFETAIREPCVCSWIPPRACPRARPERSTS